ncbi:MAG: methionyl-tRNA formyltransferase [Clostridia bacterium]|nr:methionyl-tRNA formyltransferase [Clostridia bacterium]
MRIVFAGSPEFAVPALKALHGAGVEIAAVLTQPDKPVGRKKILTPTPVKAAAVELGLPVYDFAKIREHVKDISGLADIMITCAYGQILTREVLNCFKGGVWNLHASLLPKFRGASPIQSAILAGEKYTGVTVMKTELEIDSGDILLVKRCEVGEKTYGELRDELSALAAEAAVEAIGYLKAGEPLLLMQDEAGITHCKKINKENARIDFNKTAEDIVRLIRAMNPEPVAYCLQNGSVLNILNAQIAEGCGAAGEVLSADKKGVCVACANGAVLITELIPAGGKRMKASDYCNGRKIKAGDKLD